MRLFRSLYRASIWAPGAVPEDEIKYRSMKTVLFPVVDILFFLGGLSAARFGVPAISEFFHDNVVDFFSLALSIAATVAFVGVAFPSQWRLEIGAKSVILGLLVAYFVSLFILTVQGEGNRGFVLLISTVAIAVVVWRMSIIGYEWRERRLEALEAEALLGGD